MSNRREFLKSVAGASAGLFMLSAATGVAEGRSSQSGSEGSARRIVTINNRRVKTIDVHAHIFIPEVADFIKGTSLQGRIDPSFAKYDRIQLGSERLEKMDREGVDVQALSINSFWNSADRDLARRLIDFQNEKLAGMCATRPDRFVAFASVSLKFPELAAQQLEEGMKRWGFRGAAVGGSIEGKELSSPEFDPFWAKAEELQALIFVHPQDSAVATGVQQRVKGNGALYNVIGNPLETTIFLSHMIFEGTLDRFPKLRICAAHGGGFLPSYAARMDHGCSVFPERCGKMPKKLPTEYLKQIYFDALVFTPEGLQHLINVCGVSQIGMGTDYPFPWESAPVDQVMATPGLSDADRIAILGGNMAKLLKIPA